MSIYQICSPLVLEPNVNVLCEQLKSTQISTIDALGNVLYSLPSSSVPDPSDLMVFHNDGSSSFVSTASLLPANPNALLNDSSTVQSRGTVFIADSNGIGGTTPSLNFTISEAGLEEIAVPDSINVLNGAYLKFVDTASSLTASLNIDTNANLDISCGTENQLIRCLNRLYLDKDLQIKSSLISLDDMNSLNFTGAGNYSFDANISAPNIPANIVSNPVQTDLSLGAHQITDIYALSLNSNFTHVANQFHILENPANTLLFDGASLYNFTNDLHSSGSLSADNGLTITGSSTFNGPINMNNGLSSFYISIEAATNIASFNNAASYTFSANINTGGSIYGSAGIGGAQLTVDGPSNLNSSVYVNNDSGLFFNNVTTTNNAVINSSGLISDDLLINTAGTTSTLLLNGNQVQTTISGTTLARPLMQRVGYMYFDTNLGFPIWFDGVNYVNALGAIV